ncbi:MAG TPA: flippase [Blastocatellia bacterium]|nr:flippase [Blastocatellia bacterium]
MDIGPNKRGSLATAQRKDATNQSLIGGAVSLTLCNVISQVINYGIHIGAGRFLAPGVYGYFGIIVSTFSILETILRWGLSTAVAFYIARDKGGAKQILKKALQLQTIYALVWFAVFFSFSDRLAVILGDPGLSSYLRMGAFFIVAFAFLPVYVGFLNGMGHFRRQGAIAVIRSVVKLLFIVTLLVYGMEIYGVIVAYTASTLAATFYGLWASRPNRGAPHARVEAKNIVAFGFPLFISSLAASLLVRMDLFMIQSLLNDRVLTGLYTSAVALIKAPYFLSLGTGLVVFRSVAQLRAKNPSEVRGFVSKTVYYYLLLLAPLPFILSASAEQILGLTFGDDYLLAAPVLKILSFCLVFMVLLNLVTTLIAGLDRPRWSMALSLGLLPVQFFLIHEWISTMGLAGVALATTITYVLGALVGTVFLLREGHLVLPNWKTFFKVGIGCVSSYTVTRWGSPSGLWLIALCPLIYFFYLALVRFMGELNDCEVRPLVEKFLPLRSVSLVLRKDS